MRVVPPVTDPGAELARLRRPTGPWLHLLDAAPADARQLGWLLGQDGVVVRILRGHCGRSTYGFLDEIGAALQLPGDPAEDWPALGALLTDMAWLPGAGHVLVVTRASLLLAAEPVRELGGLVEAVREVARGRAEEGEPVPFHLVLQDDTVGIATLRQRLDAVGAKHADLSGWDAEEPVAEVVAGRRSVLVPGPPHPDEVDRAAGAAVSEVDGVESVGRAWEEFRGGTGRVRVYAPVLTESRWAAHTAALIAEAAAGLDAACLVVPVPADAGTHDPRQAAVAAAAAAVWPVPEVPEVVAGVPAAPTATAPQPASEPPASTDTPAQRPAAVRVPASIPVPAPAAAVPAAAGPDAAGLAPTVDAGGPDAAGVAPTLDAGGPDAFDRSPVPAAQPADQAPVTGPASAAGAAAPERERAAGRPGDVAGGDFELVAADLQWDFDPGEQVPDAVDSAVVAHVRAAGRTVALFRTWARDPDDGWVRVVLAYVGPRGSIAEVEGERTAVVDTLQRAGAVRCCVEVLAAADVTDVHRWLEERCEPLWPPAPDRRTGSPPAATPARSAEQPPSTERPATSLPADTTFVPGPGAAEAETGALVRWAAERPGVVALVTGWAELDGARTLVVGIALDGGTHPDPVRAEAEQLAPGARVEPFTPSRGLDPTHLRLTRSGTRVWQRRPERAAAREPQPATDGALSRPDAPKVVSLGPAPVRDTDEPRGDVQLAGFTLVGIDRETEIDKGAPVADERDAALVEWARAEPAAIALLRAVASVDEETIPVYCACVTTDADPEAVRRQLAAAVAATGTPRAAAEAFAPAGVISAFHLDLAVGSTRLWPQPPSGPG